MIRLVRPFAAALLIAAALLVPSCGKRVTLPLGPQPFVPPPTLTQANPLDGVRVPPEALGHRVVAVMIDNYPDARPQSGLRDADIVYEVEAEGGITRYMALYLDTTPGIIGPVRSARLYFVDLARPYNPYYAHAGENADVWAPLDDLKHSGFADVEQILGVQEAFWRDPSRYMPHNLYTSVARIRGAGPHYGWPDKLFEGKEFAFADMPAPADPPDVDLGMWMGYNARFHYDRGTYVRYVKGELQHDRDDMTPYRISDIIVTWMPARVIDSVGDLDMNVFGKFPAFVIRNGHTAKGFWVAPGPDNEPAVEDTNGHPIPLVPGQIYVEILPQGGTLTIGKNTWSH